MRIDFIVNENLLDFGVRFHIFSKKSYGKFSNQQAKCAGGE